MAGKFVTEWQNLLQSAQVDFKEIDVAAGVSALLAAKDSEELVRCVFLSHFTLLSVSLSSLPVCSGKKRALTIFFYFFSVVGDGPLQQNERNAATMTSKLMSHFSDVMSGYIDAGKKVTHERLAEEIEGKLEDNKWWKTLKLGDNVRFWFPFFHLFFRLLLLPSILFPLPSSY